MTSAWRSRALLTFLTTFTVVACKAPDNAAPPEVPAGRFANSVGLPISGREGEARFAEMARRVPSFAGFYYDESGNLIVEATDVAVEGTAKTAALSVLQGLPSQHAGGRVIFRQAQYTFDQLAAWRDVISRDYLGTSGVLSVDADEVRNRVTLGVEDLGRRDEILSSIAKTDLPVAALFLEQTSPVVREDTLVASGNLVRSGDIIQSPPGTRLDSYFEPIPAGVLITYRTPGLPAGYYYACTMGYGVKSGKVAAARGDSIFFLGASHCSEVQFEPGSTDYYQPELTAYSGHPEYFLGTEKLDPFYFICCVKHYRTRYSDALLADVQGSRHLLLDRIAKPTYYSTGRTSGTPGSTTVDQSDPYFYVVRKDASVPVGYTVDKVGYRTGWTRGTVNSTCVDRWDAGTGYKWLCNTLAYYWSEQGDSGGPVFIELGGNQIAAVGIHWGGFGSNGGRNGSAVISPFGNIERSDELGPLVLP